MHQYASLNDTLYFGFGLNDTSGSGNDGSSPSVLVREVGAAASAAPVQTLTPTLLTHADYDNGAYEIAIAANSGYGYQVNTTYLVYAKATSDGQTPMALIGSFTLTALAKSGADGDTLKTLSDQLDGVQTDIARILGLSGENLVWDDTLYDGNGKMTAATGYQYDNKANAQTHNKLTGLIGKWTLDTIVTTSNVTLLRIVKES